MYRLVFLCSYRSVIEIGNFMKMHSGPKVLMGDMNAEPHSDSIRYRAKYL